MDKKPRLNLNSQCAKVVSSDSSSSSSSARKSQDGSGGKQWPRSTTRPNTNSAGNNTKADNGGKSRPNANFDKRYRNSGANGHRGGITNNNNGALVASAGATGSGSRLTVSDQFEAELNSVYLPGSKKQNLNHLLNFNYAPRWQSERGTIRGMSSGHAAGGGGGRKVKYNKEQFLQATCQFVVRADIDWQPYTVCPDTLVAWQFIEQVHVQTVEEPQCPICLYHPVAGKMTRCGHVYCWPCVLHYLALSDKSWRKCPICYEAIHVGDLKSAISLPHVSYNVGDYVNLQLMCREKGSLQVTKMTAKPKLATAFPHLFGDVDEIVHSKLILADSSEILSIIERERNELRCQLSLDGADCPESMFIQQSLDLLQIRENDVLKMVKKTEQKKRRQSVEEGPAETAAAAEITALVEELSIATPTAAAAATPEPCESVDFIIDEDSNLTVHDIDIQAVDSSSKHFYFYQAADGQQLYMHSLNVRMLQAEYGSLAAAPAMIRGKIVQKESCSMSEVLRKRLKYLQHLPVTSQFEVVEIGLDHAVLSDEVWARFREELGQRQKMRQHRAKLERKREKQIDEVNDRQIGKIIARSANIDVTSDHHFPMCNSYESPPAFLSSPSESLLGSPGAAGVTTPSATGNSSFARMLTAQPKAEFWPTLATPAKAAPIFAEFRSSAAAAAPRQTRRISESDEDYELDADARVPPDFNASFGNAIAEAMHNKAVQAALAASLSKPGAGGKKKKNKKTILFSTGGRTFNGN